MNISKSNLHIYWIHRLCSKLLPLQALAPNLRIAPFQMYSYYLNILLELYHQFTLGTDTNTYTQGLISTRTKNVAHHPAEDFFIQEFVMDEQELAGSRGEPYRTCFVTSGKTRNEFLCQTCRATMAYISSQPGADRDKSIHPKAVGFRRSLPKMPGKAGVYLLLMTTHLFQRYNSYSENKYLYPFPCDSKPLLFFN